MIDNTTKMIDTTIKMIETTTEMIDVIDVHAGTLTTSLAFGAVLYGMFI